MRLNGGLVMGPLPISSDIVGRNSEAFGRHNGGTVIRWGSKHPIGEEGECVKNCVFRDELVRLFVGHVVLAFLLGKLLSANAEAEPSGPVWDSILEDIAFTNAPLAAVLRDLEIQSQVLVPTGAGISIGFAHERDASTTFSSLKFRLTNASLSDVVRYVGEVAGFAVVFQGNSATYCRLEYARRLAAVFGSCRDALNGEPVSGLDISCLDGESVRSKSTIDACGDYAVLLSLPSRYYSLDGKRVYEPISDSLSLVFSAPGYTSSTSALHFSESDSIKVELNVFMQREAE